MLYNDGMKQAKQLESVSHALLLCVEKHHPQRPTSKALTLAAIQRVPHDCQAIGMGKVRSMAKAVAKSVGENNV